MELVFRALGLTFAVSFGPDGPTEMVENDVSRLGTSDSSFGFAGDPLVRPYWTDDSDDY